MVIDTLDKKIISRDFPGGPVIRMRFAMQGTRVPSLVRNLDPTCPGVTKPQLERNLSAATGRSHMLRPRPDADQSKYISLKKIKYRGFSDCPMVRALHPHCSALQATQRGQNKNQASCSLDPRRGLGSRVIYSGRSPVLTMYPTGLPRLPTHFPSLGPFTLGSITSQGGKKSLWYRSGNPTLTCPLGPNQ